MIGNVDDVIYCEFLFMNENNCGNCRRWLHYDATNDGTCECLGIPCDKKFSCADWEPIQTIKEPVLSEKEENVFKAVAANDLIGKAFVKHEEFEYRKDEGDSKEQNVLENPKNTSYRGGSTMSEMMSKCPINGNECRSKCALFMFGDDVCAITSIADSLKTIAKVVNDGYLEVRIKEKEE